MSPEAESEIGEREKRCRDLGVSPDRGLADQILDLTQRLSLVEKHLKAIQSATSHITSIPPIGGA